MASESDIQARIALAIGSRPDCRIFRNHCGFGWTGELVSQRDGLTVLRNARPAIFGLAPGSADLIGWTRRLVTPADIGAELAIFTSLEVKRLRGGRTAAEQATWRDAVASAGGIAAVVRSPEEAVNAITNRRNA